MSFTRASPWWKFFFLLLHSQYAFSRLLKAFEFENPVLTLRRDIVGGGGNLLTGSQTDGPSFWVHHLLNKKISDESLPSHQLGGEKQFKEKNCLEAFIMMASISIRSCLLKTL